MKVWQYLIGGLAVIGIAIQLVPNELPAVNSGNPEDLIGSGVVDGEVAGLLKKACYDCHSNETKYPWYSHVAPISWLVAKDTREGREELNFSNWTSYDMMEKLEKLDDIAIEVGEGEMPMKVYTYVHSEAKLKDLERKKLIEWAEATMDVVAEEEDSEEGVE